MSRPTQTKQAAFYDFAVNIFQFTKEKAVTHILARIIYTLSVAALTEAIRSVFTLLTEAKLFEAILICRVNSVVMLVWSPQPCLLLFLISTRQVEDVCIFPVHIPMFLSSLTDNNCLFHLLLLHKVKP